MSPMQAWEHALVASYTDVARTRMAGLPLLHPGLQVQAVGMREHDDGWLGVLVTPWFMNLVWRACQPDAQDALPVGQTRERRVGQEVFSFVGSSQERLGPFEACSLISPMFQFADQDAAVATAQLVLRELFPERRPAGKQAAVLGAKQAAVAVAVPVTGQGALSHGAVPGSVAQQRQAPESSAAMASRSAVASPMPSQEPVDQRRRSLFGLWESRR